MTEEKYLKLLQEEVSDRLVDLDLLYKLWYQQNGCPAHNYGLVTTFFRNTFPGYVIGTHEELAWLLGNQISHRWSSSYGLE